MKRIKRSFLYSWLLWPCIIVFFLTIESSSYAQVKLGNNHSTIDDRSLLEMESSDKALMLPRLTTAQRDGQTGWKAGHVIYNTTDSCIATFDGVTWRCLDSVSSPWYKVSDNKVAKAIDDTMYHLGSARIGTGSASGKYALTVGDSCMASGDYSVAMGRRARAVSDASFAFGDSSVASGNFSTAMGYLDSATGDGSVAIGYQSTATGEYSTSIGRRSRGYADNSTAIGGGLVSPTCRYSLAIRGLVQGNNKYSQISIGGRTEGHSAIAIGFGHAYDDYTIAIGTGARALKEGNVALGTDAWTYRENSCAIGRRTNADSTSVAIGYKATARDVMHNGAAAGTVISSIAIGEEAWVRGSYSVGLGYKTRVDHNNSMAIGSNATTTANNQLFAKFTGGYRFETNAGGSSGVTLAAGAGSWSSISDQRAKQDIEDIPYGLNHLLKLNPSTYKYKGGNLQSLGFIAQEVLEVVPEVVNVPDNQEEMMSVRYAELIPVLTKAIQDLNQKVEELNQKVDELESENKSLKE
ncbi:MAG: tail fiber domain-containing protein [Bacteroidia bacterium]|nr:tail fiber domain-containing protein [Bacteroidia bacterium]